MCSAMCSADLAALSEIQGPCIAARDGPVGGDSDVPWRRGASKRLFFTGASEAPNTGS